MAAKLPRAGLLGDRAYGLVDSSDGKVASARTRGSGPTLFDFRAMLAEHQDRARRCRLSASLCRTAPSLIATNLTSTASSKVLKSACSRSRGVLARYRGSRSPEHGH
jgi:hypothetical protein